MNRVVFMSIVAGVSFLTGFAFKIKVSKQINRTTEIKNANKQLDEELIHKIEAAYDRAWRDGDVDGVVACLTKNALLINPRGEVATGHKEIRDLLSKFLNGPAKGSIHTSRVTRVNFVTNDAAVVDGEAIIEGMEFTDSSTLTHRFTDILVRSGDVWLIAQVRAYANYQI